MEVGRLLVTAVMVFSTHIILAYPLCSKVAFKAFFFCQPVMYVVKFID